MQKITEEERNLSLKALIQEERSSLKSMTFESKDY